MPRGKKATRVKLNVARRNRRIGRRIALQRRWLWWRRR